MGKLLSIPRSDAKQGTENVFILKTLLAPVQHLFGTLINCARLERLIWITVIFGLIQPSNISGARNRIGFSVVLIT